MKIEKVEKIKDLTMGTTCLVVNGTMFVPEEPLNKDYRKILEFKKKGGKIKNSIIEEKTK